MNIEEEEWVKHALLDYERKRSISKILTFDCKDALPKGSNYMSDMLRLNLKTVLHSGDIVNRSLIYKAMPQTEGRKKLIKASNFDKIEAMMFTDVIPQMEKIRQEKGHGVEPLFPVCYGIRSGLKGFLMEDLSVIGYKMADRRKLLDFNHANLVMKALAEFHALSAILIKRGEVQANDFKYNYYHYAELFEPWIFPTVPNFAKHIEENWGDEWSCYGEKIREFLKTVMPKVLEEMKYNENNFNAIQHCDCWATNVMFRYSSDGLPQNIRLLDFQLCTYNNVGLDVQFFMNTSLNAETLERKEDLIRTYYNHLKASLLLYEYPENIPSFEDIVACCNRTSIFGLICALVFIPFIVQPQDNVPDDLEEWTKGLASDTGLELTNFESESLRSCIEVILKQASSNGLL